jgi:hypothetical protein
MKPLARPSSLSFRLQLLLLTILGLAVDSCRSSVGILRLAYVVRIVCALGQNPRVVGSDVDGEAFRALDVVVDSNVLNYHPWSAWVPFEQIVRGVTLTYDQVASKRHTDSHSDANGKWRSRAGLDGGECEHKGATDECFAVHFG